MNHEKKHLEKLDAARAALARAEAVLSEAASKARTAKGARASGSPTAADKELRRLRDDDEIADERMKLATRARDVARATVANLEHDLPFAVDADGERRIGALLEQMRAHVRAARELRLQADAIDAEKIAPLWTDYIQTAGVEGHQIDHRVEAAEDRPRDLHDLYEATARLDGIAIPTRWERTPLGAFQMASARRVAAWARSSFSSDVPEEPAGKPDWRAEAPPTRHVKEAPQFEWSDVKGAEQQ